MLKAYQVEFQHIVRQPLFGDEENICYLEFSEAYIKKDKLIL